MLDEKKKINIELALSRFLTRPGARSTPACRRPRGNL
jgi:hypothetical protein